MEWFALIAEILCKIGQKCGNDEYGNVEMQLSGLKYLFVL